MINGYIREATADDIELLQHIKTVGALQAYGRKHDQTDIQRWLNENATRAYFEDRLSRSDYRFLILEQHGYALAMASIEIDGECANFGNLYCLVQSLGLGSSLSMYREQVAAEHRCKRAIAYTWPTNTPAIGFLIRHGFVPMGAATHPIVGHRILKFEKELAY